MSNFSIDKYGNKEWHDENGFRHREDGPAFENTHGDKYWYHHGKLHRTDGPAYINGMSGWWFNGKCHRLDGPAVEHASFKAWSYEGKHIDCKTQEEFERIVKLLAFC